MKTSIATATAQYKMSVNASGNGCMYIFPLNVIGDAVTDSTAFVSVVNDATFNPATGIGGTSEKFVGPLLGSTAAIEQFMLSGFSVTVRSTVAAI